MAANDLPIDRRALLTQADAAALAHVDRSVVAAWMREPDFPSATYPHLKHPRIPRAAFLRWLDARAEGSAA